MLRQRLLRECPTNLKWGNVSFENHVWHRMDTDLFNPATLLEAFGTSDSKIIVAIIH